MKRLFSLCALVMLVCLAANTFAADIVVRTVKIKKRNCSRLSPVEAGCLDWATCFPASDDDNFMDIKEGDITTTTGYDAKAGNYTTLSFSFAADSRKKAGIVKAATLFVTVIDCNLKSTTRTIACYPGKDGLYEGTCTIYTGKEVCAQLLTSANIVLTTDDGLETLYELMLNKKDKETTGGEGCDTKFSLKDVTYLTDNQGGFYIMAFSFGFEKKDMPESVTMAIQVTDCKGNKATLHVAVAYDPATGQCAGNQGIAQNKDCPWTLTYGEVYATNPCDDETTWAVDFGGAKSNGTGTRTGASTVKTKPALK